MYGQDHYMDVLHIHEEIGVQVELEVGLHIW